MRGAVVAQLATNALWMAPRAYRRTESQIHSEEEEDSFTGAWQRAGAHRRLFNEWGEEGTWQRAVELRHRVKGLLGDATRAGLVKPGDEYDEFDDDEAEEDEDDEFDDDEELDEDGEYNFDEDDDE